MDLSEFSVSNEDVLNTPKKNGTGGRPSYKKAGIDYASLTNDLPIETIKKLKTALGGRFYPKRQAEVVNDAILFYLENHK